jgi:hypothetical protein
LTVPDAPWSLGGEAVVGLVVGRRPATGLPADLAPLPGPVLIVATCYDESPVGPYLELAVGVPARLGLRPGWCMTTMVVDSSASRRGGRDSWGLPKEVGRLTWRRDGEEREMRWPERGVVVRGTPMGPALPGLVPVRALQRRLDGPVVVPGRLRGRGRVATVSFVVPEADPLAPLAGSHLGVQVAGMRFLVRPARQPVGVASTLRAPLRAPETAMGTTEGH